MLKTKRLVLRQWQEEDFRPFSQLCDDPDVMEFFPKRLDVKESHDLATKIQKLITERGWGFWAVEKLDDKQFIGFVGLHTPAVEMPFSPCVEIGWRLSKQYWGKGYATEAARESLRFAFDSLRLDEVVSFTTLKNIRSQAVMRKIGMQNCQQNFKHPDIDDSHPLCEHVLFKISTLDWRSDGSQ